MFKPFRLAEMAEDYLNIDYFERKLYELSNTEVVKIELK